MIQNKNFSGVAVADIPADTEYEQCNFSRPQPVDVGGLKRGVRLFPQDDYWLGNYSGTASQQLTLMEAVLDGEGNETSPASPLGPLALTVEAGRDYFTGQVLKISYDAAAYMVGTVTDYNATTGALAVNITSVVGNGTFETWAVELVVPYSQPPVRTFRNCNLLNCEVPPGSIVVDCNQHIIEKQVFSHVDEIVVNDVVVSTISRTKSVHHGGYIDGVPVDLPAALEYPE